MKWADKTLMPAKVSYRLCMGEQEFRGILRWLKVPVVRRPEFIAQKSYCAVTHTFDASDGRRFCVVCMPFKKNEPPLKVVATLVHEAVHVWQVTTQYIEETAPSCEFEAYSIETIASELIKEYANRLRQRTRAAR